MNILLYHHIIYKLKHVYMYKSKSKHGSIINACTSFYDINFDVLDLAFIFLILCKHLLQQIWNNRVRKNYLDCCMWTRKAFLYKVNIRTYCFTIILYPWYGIWNQEAISVIGNTAILLVNNLLFCPFLLFWGVNVI